MLDSATLYLTGRGGGEAVMTRAALTKPVRPVAGGGQQD
jgi:hypothetical protein